MSDAKNYFFLEKSETFLKIMNNFITIHKTMVAWKVRFDRSLLRLTDDNERGNEMCRFD